MKKFILTTISLVVTLTTIACTNPSMDEGFSKLNQSLAELEAAIASLNIEQMQSDLEMMNTMAEQMIIDAEDAQNAFDGVLNDLSYVNQILDSILEDSEGWATAEQMDELKAKVDEFGEGVDTLVAIADYDLDGVINAIDRCPNTPLNKIHQVNGFGCAAGETPVDGN